METKKTSRQKLLETAETLFRTRGYHHTSVADVAKACGLRKASLYHHVSSKEELGKLVLKMSNARATQAIFNIVYNENTPLSDRFEQFATRLEHYCLQQKGGCLFANMAMETFDTVTCFQDTIIEFFDNMIGALTYLLSKKYSADEARLMANNTIAWLEGTIMLNKVYKNSNNSSKVKQKILSLAKGNLTTKTAAELLY